jgi:hypothetical protein
MGAAEMPSYDRTKIQEFLQRADRARKTATRGKAYEELACYLFGCVPGITITGRNQMNTFATEEIDVACFNEQHPAGLRSLNPFLWWSVRDGGTQLRANRLDGS